MKTILTIIFIVFIGLIFVRGQFLKISNDDPTTIVKIDSNSIFTYEIKNFSFNTKTEMINSPSGIMTVGPNYIPYPTTATQSEIHAYSNPNLQGRIMVGWVSFGPSFYGTGFAYTSNAGINWTGNYTLPGLSANAGDPSVAITSNGYIFMNAIGGINSRQYITWSTNGGTNWAPYIVAGQNSSGDVADKNHLGIDDKLGSPYYDNLYIGWTDFSVTGPPLKIVRSTNLGVNWSTSMQVTLPLTGHYSQGININTGPNGEVYFVCATNIVNVPFTEDYIGFGKSTNGGLNWIVNESAIDINGIRGYLKTSGIRVNSFPWMAVDKTGGSKNGWIYVTWAQVNLAPAGNDPDILLSKSTNGGLNWSIPVRVNDDSLNNGRDQWFSNINIDFMGGINIIFYDSRNPTTNDSAEVYVARSVDGGNTFENIKVSDHRFKPTPISGLAGGYQGDYIGIASTNIKLFPFWCDNYTGTYQTWTTNIELGPSIIHIPLTYTEQTTGTRPVSAQIIPAGSGINPSQTKLFFTKNPSIFTDSVVMTNSGGTNWNANIILSGSGTYRYYIKATDSLSRVVTAPGGAPETFYSFIATPDTIKPVIIHIPISDIPKANWPVSVSASATDNTGIDSVWVRWYKNTTNNGIKHFKLLHQGGSNYSALFNSVNADVQVGDSIFYRIFARDTSIGHNTDSTALYGFKIVYQANVCIGTGEFNIGWPFYTYFMDSRTDMLYLGNEIGLAPPGGYVTKIGFTVVTAASQIMNGFKIKMQNTTVNSITGFTSAGWTTVYDGTYSVPGTGLQYIELQSPFYYSSSYNLLIEICFNNSTYTNNTIVQGSTASGRNAHHHTYLTSTDGCTDILIAQPQYSQLPDICILLNPGPQIGISNQGNELPSEYELYQNYPNPFNPTTKIYFSIPKQGLVTLKVYDVLGREVANLVNEVKTAGNYIVDFDASYLASGVYFYKLEVNGFSDVKRLVLIK
jgi:hypothetical protein